MHWLTLRWLAAAAAWLDQLPSPSAPVHALPLAAHLAGHAVRVLEAVDVRQVHALGHAGHVGRVQLLVAVWTPAADMVVIRLAIQQTLN